MALYRQCVVERYRRAVKPGVVVALLALLAVSASGLDTRPVVSLASAVSGPSVSAGYEHTCAIKSDASVVCWGDNSSGQASPPSGAFAQVSAGSYDTCGLKTDGTVTCWGDNTWGESSVPTGTFTQITVGLYHACALRTDGSVVCWGYNAYGQASPPAGAFTQISAGGYHTCGIKPDGTLACWGDNSDGQSSPPVEPSPRSVPEDITPAAWRAVGHLSAGAAPRTARYLR
jgi:alpha-tubulin suppressor-like RCC1 family protein